MTDGGGLLPGGFPDCAPPKGAGWCGDHWTFAGVGAVAEVQGWEELDLLVPLS